MAKYRKIYGGDGQSLTPINFEKDRFKEEIRVEEKLSPSQLRHLHACIRYTQAFKQNEANERAEKLLTNKEVADLGFKKK